MTGTALRLALVSAPLTLAERYGVFAGAANTEPSFGLACLGAVARAAGSEVLLVEAAAENLGLAKTLERLVAYSPQVVGISATTAGICAAGELARRIKGQLPHVCVIIGGCHVTAIPEQTLAEFPAFDLAVVGEGEAALRELIERHVDGDPVPADLAGTVVRVDDRTVRNPARPLIANLDELPLPAWALLPGFPRAFRPAPMRIRRWPCASIVLTRGCPNQCTFCDRSVFGNRCRAYSAEYAVRMVRDLCENFGVRELLLEDDTFTMSRQRVTEFCERLSVEGMDVSWSCLARADRVNPELLRAMKQAGCWHVSYGIESGDTQILEAVNKHLDLEQIHAAVQWSKEAGLRTKGFFMVGLPGETEASLQATRRLALSLPLDEISVMQLTPFPGSQIYESADGLGTFQRDWRRMNTLETVFVPRGLTKTTLDDARAALLRRFYWRPRVLWGYLLHVLRWPAAGRGMLRGVLALLRSTLGK